MEHLDKNNLTEGPIRGKLLRFLFPVMLGMLFQQLYNTVDAIIVGKYVGKEALAAVGGSPAMIINLVIGFFTGLGAGATVIAAQYFGAQNRNMLSRTVHTAFAFSLAVGAVLTVLGMWLTPWALSAVDTPPDILELSAEYLRIYFSGTIFTLIFNVGSGILRAVGDSRRPLYYLIVCCVLNIVLDLVFVKALGLGAAGVGYATVVSLAVSAVLVTVSLCLSQQAHRLRLSGIRLDLPALRQILRIGIPSGVQSAMYSASNLIIQVAINRFGTTVVAAWTAIGKFDGIFWVISNSIGITVCAFVGQCFGAGRYARMKQGVKSCFLLAAGAAAVISVLLLVFAQPGMHLITDDSGVIAYSVEMLWYFVPFYLVWSVIEVLSNTLRGAGDSVRPTLIVTVGVCLLRVLWMLFVVPVWYSVQGISMSYPVSWVITAIVLAVYYFKSNWLARCSSQAAGSVAPAETKSV